MGVKSMAHTYRTVGASRPRMIGVRAARIVKITPMAKTTIAAIKSPRRRGRVGAGASGRGDQGSELSGVRGSSEVTRGRYRYGRGREHGAGRG